ncbi:PREDICTED: GDP-mannose transporter [Prunus dulcis]|uniref:PREDICTED: GDP-mannose transporter n=1 Tax=Prunus dulcis TaxID=3755 RepID=A0A5E4F7R8_PRUDU|nr:GDP-mannose transporter GONST3 [Prunus dulcis]XP_034214591.1 GDP-mannose transporter GONST3 [Prunus dulcis]XP_034214592.1 GDP-mannose transporter GONST3 [Prunus dulcis]VVA23199.1 PREDICTED: GDP-mannose transporter [Prunus dulcis]
MGTAHSLTEEGRNGGRELTWDDKEVCGHYLVRFCPFDLFVNTRSDIGPCPRIHDPKLKESFEKSPQHDAYVAKFEAELAQFCEILVMDLDRRVRRERERRHQEVEPAPPHPPSTEQYEQLSVVEEKLKNLLEQVEALGEAGKMDEAEAPVRKMPNNNGVENPEAGRGRQVQGGSSSPTLFGNSQSNSYSVLLQQISVYGVAAGYCLSASLLSIINKWAVVKFPYPGALTALQYFTSVIGVLVCGQLKLIEYDSLYLLTMWRFLPAAIIFYLSLFTNSELLLHANVDTFIVFRSVVPIFVAIGETLFLHQPWPSMRTWTSLATIFGGSVIFVLTDYQFTVTAYSWALAYLVSMSIDFVYIKHVVMTIGLNTWGLVLYNNLEALLLFPLELLVMGELKKIKHEISDESDWYSLEVLLPVGLSCLFGLSISFFGFSCRRAISATGFTVLGIVNKLLTVVINLVIWDKHSTFVGTVGLLICMAGGVMYQQSTSKKPEDVNQVKAQETQEEKQKLIETKSSLESKNNEKWTAESEGGK